MTDQVRIDFESMPWEDASVGVKFKAYEQGGKKLRLAVFTKEFIETVWCDKGHIGYVLEGQMEIDFDGKSIVFNPGDGIFIRPDEKHKHKGRTITDTVKVILVEDA